MKLVIEELDKLFNDDANHEIKIILARHPSVKETQMIRSYAQAKFMAKVAINLLND